MMKKIQSAVYGAAAVLTAILPKIFVCPQGGGTDAMRCWQTAIGLMNRLLKSVKPSPLSACGN